MGEVSIAGVFAPALLIWGLVAVCISAMLRRVLAAFGLYRFVWHRALFDLAVFVIVLGGTVGVASRLVGP